VDMDIYDLAAWKRMAHAASRLLMGFRICDDERSLQAEDDEEGEDGDEEELAVSAAHGGRGTGVSIDDPAAADWGGPGRHGGAVNVLSFALHFLFSKNVQIEGVGPRLLMGRPLPTWYRALWVWAAGRMAGCGGAPHFFLSVASMDDLVCRKRMGAAPLRRVAFFARCP
jgi:hypothetical protein